MSIDATPRTGRADAPGDRWLPAMGFEAVHEPGISRAWRLASAAGYLLITDVGGYDLPDADGPASAYLFTRGDELVEFVEYLEDARALRAWVDSSRLRLERMDAPGGFAGT